MSSAYKILVRLIISLLFAVYLTLLLKMFFPLNKLILLITTGLVIFLTCYLISGFVITHLYKKVGFKRIAFLSVGMAALIMIAAPSSVNPGNEPQEIGYVKITALGIKNDSARGSEIWIKNIYNGGGATNLSTIPLSDDWDEKYHQIVSYRKQPATQEIKIKYQGSYEIEFLKHAWSGKVKIEDGKNTTIIDLYKHEQDPSDSYKYVSNSIFINKKKVSRVDVLGSFAITFLTLSIFWFVCFAYVQIKNNYFLLLFPLSIFVFFLSDYFPLTFTGKFFALALSIGAIYVTRRISVLDYANKFTVKEKAFFILVILYGTFACVGHQLFLSGYPVKHIGHKIAYFLLFGGWLTFISIAFLYLTELIRNKVSTSNLIPGFPQQNQSSLKLFLTFFGIMAACWLLYFIAFFPATMSADSLDQWEQATGGSQLNNWHPAFHTLFNKLCITIYKSPASIALAQIIFMGIVMSAFLLFLYQKGIPVKWLKWMALVIGLIPANGIMSVTLWKDVLFSISLVWLTLVLAKIVTNDAYLKQRSAYVEVTLALVAAGLFRHNGIPVYILAIVGLLGYYFKTKKAGILVCISLSLVLMAGYFMYTSNPDRVVPNPSAVKLVAPIHGIAAVKYYNGNLDKETIQEMDKVLPDSIWRSHYRPFSADEYLFFTPKKNVFVKDLSNLHTSKALRLYLNTLAKNPYLVIRDRLNGTEIVWNVLEANGSFNYRYCHVIDENPFGFKSPSNFLRKVIEHYLEETVKIADPFLWRAGIFNFLLLLLMLLLAKQNKWYLLLFIPVMGTNFSLMLSMTLQNFRYVYYVPMIFGFIWLLSISNIMAGGKFKTDAKS